MQLFCNLQAPPPCLEIVIENDKIGSEAMSMHGMCWSLVLFGNKMM